MKAIQLSDFFAVVRLSLFAVLLFDQVTSTRMARRTVNIEIPSDSIGTKQSIQAHYYGQKSSVTRCAYIQASLHADELPGCQADHTFCSHSYSNRRIFDFMFSS